MLNIIIDDYKLQLFLFEKMGSRSIEDALNNKVGNHNWEGLIIRISQNDEGYPDGMEVEGGIFKYRKYDGRITESYLDLDNRPWEVVWPEDYKTILIYRNPYHRLVSCFYNALNSRGKNKEGWSDEHGRGAWDVYYKELDIMPKSENLEAHIKSFHNFCKLHFVTCPDHWIDGVFFGKLGHMGAIWEEIPKYLTGQVDEIMSLQEVNSNKLIESFKKQEVPEQKLKEFKKSLNNNKKYYTKLKSQMDRALQHLRPTDDYEVFFNTMEKETLDAITNFYEWDLEFTGGNSL